MERLGRLLACFVTERKHKTVMKFALATWRWFEHTTLLDVLHQQCESLSTNEDIFGAEFLIDVKKVSNTRRSKHESCCEHTPGLLSSKEAAYKGGTVKAKDIICTKGGLVGRVQNFLQVQNGPVQVRFLSYLCIEGDCTLRDENASTIMMVPLADVLDACIWCYAKPGVLKVCIPPPLLF